MFKHIRNLSLLPSTAALTSAAMIGALALVSACDSGEPETLESRSFDPAELPAPAPELEGSAAHDPGAAIPGAPLREQIMKLQPRKTRAGWLRFTDPVINQAEVAPLLLERLDAGTDEPAVRAALAEAIGRTGGDYAAEVSARVTTEQDPRVREFLVGTLGRLTDSPEALPGLLAGLQDSEAAVRSAAARTLAQRPDGAELGDALLAALGDDAAEVRSAAARTLGVLAIDAVKALEPLLDDADADVRLDALRAIDRIDPAHAAGLTVLTNLAQDDDARIQRLANTIQAR